MTTRIAIPTSILFVILFAPPASAHSLITYTVTPDSYVRAAEVKDPDVSRVIYREISPGSTQTWIRFRGTRRKRIALNLGVPRIDRLSGFRPSVALVGPGLPAAAVPLDLPPDAGALIFASRYPADTQPEVFHEEFTGTDSWMLLKTEVELPETGEYYLVAFPSTPDDAVGKLWLAIGTKERFTLGEILSFGKVRRFVRGFHEMR